MFIFRSKRSYLALHDRVNEEWAEAVRKKNYDDLGTPLWRSLLAKMDEDTAGFYLWAPLGGAAAVALYVNQTHHTWWQWLIGVPFGAMAIGFCLAVAYMAAYFGSIKVAEWHGWQPPRRNDKWERLEAQFKAAHEAEFRELYELEARL